MNVSNYFYLGALGDLGKIKINKLRDNISMMLWNIEKGVIEYVKKEDFITLVKRGTVLGIESEDDYILFIDINKILERCLLVNMTKDIVNIKFMSNIDIDIMISVHSLKRLQEELRNYRGTGYEVKLRAIDIKSLQKFFKYDLGEREISKPNHVKKLLGLAHVSKVVYYDYLEGWGYICYAFEYIDRGGKASVHDETLERVGIDKVIENKDYYSQLSNIHLLKYNGWDIEKKIKELR